VPLVLLTWSPFNRRKKPGSGERHRTWSRQQSVPATTSRRRPVFMTSFDRVSRQREFFAASSSELFDVIFAMSIIMTRRRHRVTAACHVSLAAASVHCAKQLHACQTVTKFISTNCITNGFRHEKVSGPKYDLRGAAEACGHIYSLLLWRKTLQKFGQIALCGLNDSYELRDTTKVMYTYEWSIVVCISLRKPVGEFVITQKLPILPTLSYTWQNPRPISDHGHPFLHSITILYIYNFIHLSYLYTFSIICFFSDWFFDWSQLSSESDNCISCRLQNLKYLITQKPHIKHITQL